MLPRIELPILLGMAGGRIGAVLAVALAAVAAAAPGASAAPRVPAASLSSLESNVLVDINVFRSQHHLARLRLNTALTRAAREHSSQMATKGYFAHSSADGSAFWQRIQAFYDSSRWQFWSVGENLLWSSPDVDAGGALKLWLASPEHRENLLSPKWREIGVSAVHVAHAPGTFAGRDVTIVTTDFGVRR
jgi:uncharacterized protein YkwD